MIRKILILIPAFIIAILCKSAPDEGMWIPLLIEKYNIRTMQEKGFRLSAEDIYSINKACMKDAVLSFGGGCTGEMISGEGLLITNHHCGYGQIQRHSTLEHDYLTNGFWAMNQSEELPNPGLTVTFLKRMEDVTTGVLAGVTPQMGAEEREKLIAANINNIRAKAVEGTWYTAYVRPFYMGNQYFLFVNETFRDVRLVGAPPSAIGKFGGETDNWVWPRHTGDFSLFRVYAGKDNKPADYSKSNVPYKPLYHFPISLKGVKEGDFTMVFGYPGTTYQYVPSHYIEMVKNYINPKMIEIRTAKIDIMEEAMASDPLVRIKYSAKKSGIANSWKKWIGELQGLEKMNTIEKKKSYEARITEWLNADQKRKSTYGHILPSYEELYSKLKVYNLVNSYTNDVFFSYGAEAVAFARNIIPLAAMLEKGSEQAAINEAKVSVINASAEFFRNYDLPTDMKLFATVMSMYGEKLPPEWQAPEYIKLRTEWKGDFRAAAEKYYARSVFTDEARFKAFVNNLTVSQLKKFKKDPFYMLATGVTGYIAANVRDRITEINTELQSLNQLYMRAQMEFDSNRLFYPDANSTLRVSYGNIMGYDSRDAVYFRHYSTLKGIIEKDNPEIYDYDVPDKLKELYLTKNFGKYTQDGEVPVCFIANNHTTGGNSGSPVINAEGHLIGINFDRAWEGVASDMAFNPQQSRNISLDIRFALFIIDKFAGAGYLINEMTLVE
jgi:hypothetical protein